MKTSISAALVTTLALGASAHADPLGEKGQIAIAGDFQISVVSESTDAENDDSDMDIVIAPALDIFLAPNLSVGGQFVFARSDQGELEEQLFGLGARVGYVIGRSLLPGPRPQARLRRLRRQRHRLRFRQDDRHRPRQHGRRILLTATAARPRAVA
jgi:hypothetical protein